MTILNIGPKLKQLRIKQALTLEELASRSELTKGFLSQVERDLTSPSISTLEDEMEPILLEILPESKSKQIDPHEGQELGYVLSGKITLVYGNRKSILKKGETFYIKGDESHYLENESKTCAKVIWVATPPIF